MYEINFPSPTTTWIIGFFILMAGGVVKGTLGVGLPLVVVPMLSLMIPAPQAMGIMVMPVLFSNLAQTFASRSAIGSLRRFSGLIVAQTVVTLIAVRLSTSLTLHQVNLMTAFAVISTVFLMLFGDVIHISASSERLTGLLVGGVAGFVGGVSSMTGPFLITYLIALKLKREEFVGSISLIYLFGSIPMYAAMLWFGRFGRAEIATSCLALVPIFIGIKIGNLVRERMSEKLFRGMLLGLLATLSLLLIGRSE